MLRLCTTIRIEGVVSNGSGSPGVSSKGGIIIVSTNSSGGGGAGGSGSGVNASFSCILNYGGGSEGYNVWVKKIGRVVTLTESKLKPVVGDKRSWEIRSRTFEIDGCKETWPDDLKNTPEFKNAKETVKRSEWTFGDESN